MADMKAVRNKQRIRRNFTKALYTFLSPGVEHPEPLSSDWVSQFLGDPEITQSKAKDASQDIDKAGILGRRVLYGDKGNGLKVGRNVFWTLLVPLNEAMAILDRLDATEVETAAANFRDAMQKVAANRNKPKPAPEPAPAGGIRFAPLPPKTVPVDAVVAIRTDRDGEPVEAIAGPEPERNSAFEALRSLRKDESFALVEAARQYNTRSSEIEKQINQMVENARALGIRMDEKMLRASITLDVDTRLEDVSLVLPYITQLENAVDRMAGELVGLRERLKGHDQLVTDNKRQKAQIERLIAEKTARAS